MSTSVNIHRRDLLRLAGGGAAAIGIATMGPAVGEAAEANSEFVIRGGRILTMEADIPDLLHGDVHVRDGIIVAVGADIEAPKARVIDGSNRIVMPGFVDTHWHLWNTYPRGLVQADGRVHGYFPTTLRVGPYVTAQDGYKSARLSIAEAFVSGITTIHDWSHNICSPQHADAELQAITECGIRARFSYGPPQDLSVSAPMDVADIGRVQKQWSRQDGMLSIGAAVRAPQPTPRGEVSVDLVASEIGAIRKLGLPYTIHGGGKNLISTLASKGLLGPDLLMVHPQGMTDEERKAVAASKTSYSISPVIEMSFSAVRSGYIQFAELEALHVPLCLSVDSSGVGNTDYFNVMRALLWSNWRRTDVDLKLQLNPKRIVELATIEGARRLGVDHVTGSLKPGKRADLITIRTNELNIAPVGDPYYSLVFSAQPKNVDLVVANGRVVSEGGKLTTIDMDKVIGEAVAAADALAARAPKG
jgi:cytosine/adenosine deaminase-related metal-dependent hydrolase